MLAEEVKAIVALVLRNGPIEDVHAGKSCPTCRGDQQYSRITNEEMKCIMRNAVSALYRLLLLKENDQAKYETEIALGALYAAAWDDPNEPE